MVPMVPAALNYGALLFFGHNREIDVYLAHRAGSVPIVDVTAPLGMRGSWLALGKRDVTWNRLHPALGS